MTTPQIGNKGGQLDLLIRQGATCGPNYVTLLDAAGAPVDLTGVTLRAQIRKTADAATVAASATFTTTAPGLLVGEFAFVFSATATATITCDPVSETESASLYVWDLEAEYASGVVLPIFYGDVQVFREVTRP